MRWISRLIGAVFFLVPTRSASSAREPIESLALGHLRSGELGRSVNILSRVAHGHQPLSGQLADFGVLGGLDDLRVDIFC